MKTIYDKDLPSGLTLEYLNYLTNKVFSLLPMFEESFNSDANRENFEKFQTTLIQTINGNMDLIQYNSRIVIDILSHLQSLLMISEHDNYKRHVLKTCKLINELRKEVENS